MKPIKVTQTPMWLFTSVAGTQPEDIDYRPLKRILSCTDDVCIGAEDTEDGQLHFHVYVHFPRPDCITPDILPDWDIQAVDNRDPEARRRVLDYVKKSGVYYHQKERVRYPYQEDHPVWRRWQYEILHAADDERKIICVVDEGGNTGKSYLAMWHVVRHRALDLPLIGGHRDLMRRVACASHVGCIFCDLPRATTRGVMRHIMMAAEKLKTGISFDDRYQYREVTFDIPKIVIYTNRDPDLSLLSKDRWRIYHISAQNAYQMEPVGFYDIRDRGLVDALRKFGLGVCTGGDISASSLSMETPDSQDSASSVDDFLMAHPSP